MKALSIRQPWAWAILHAGKRIENRERKDGRMPSMCSHRGPLLIHAAAGLTRAEFFAASSFMCDAGLADRPGSGKPTAIPLSWKSSVLDRGGIVGVCNVVGHIEPTGMVTVGGFDMTEPLVLDTRWHIDGSYGLVLADVRPLPFVPFKGALGFFEVPDSLVPEAFRGVDSAARRSKSG